MIDTLSGDASLGGEPVSGLRAAFVPYGSSGPDVQFGSDADDVLVGSTGNDVLYGGDGSDLLYGDARRGAGGGGDDMLDGGAGDDVLYGQDGNDTLAGGAGRDRLDGGRGDDVYIFGALDGWDTVRESAGSDTLVFNGLRLAQAQFVRLGNDLEIAFQDATLHVTLEKWFLGEGQRVEHFSFADGIVGDGGVELLALFPPEMLAGFA